MIWLLYILLLLITLCGWFLVLLLLPGLFLMTAAAAGYAAVTRGHFIGWRMLLFLLILTLIAELMEGYVGKFALHRAGGGRGAAYGAAVGGAAGGIFLTFIPVPIIGTIFGVCLGAFLGAAAMELLGGSGHRHSLGVGMGAVHARIGGIVVKLAIGFLLLVLIAVFAWP
jgi:uncharacterized protein